MNDAPADLLDDTEPATADAGAVPPDEPESSDAESVAKLQRGMADFEAGRCRPAKDLMRDIVAEEGFSFQW